MFTSTKEMEQSKMSQAVNFKRQSDNLISEDGRWHISHPSISRDGKWLVSWDGEWFDSFKTLKAATTEVAEMSAM